MSVLAERAASGDLGDLDDWTAAEERWRVHGVSLADLKYMTDDQWPFDREIGRRGFPVGAALLYHEMNRDLDEVTKHLLQLNEAKRTQARLADVFFFPLSQARPSSPPRSITPAHMLHFLQIRENNWPDLWTTATVVHWAQQNDDWVEVLDYIGRTTKLFVATSPAWQPATKELLTIARKHSDRAGLVALILGVVRYGPVVSLENLQAASFEHYDVPAVRWAALSLEMLQTSLSSARASQLAQVSAEMIREDPRRLDELLALLERYDRYDEGTDRFLLSLRNQLSDDEWKEQTRVMQTLNGSLRRRSSDLVQPAAWKSLALPERLLSLVIHR